MGNPLLGQISIVGFNFNPRGWAFCNNQLLPIAQNTALFSLLGTAYGGDGRTTFALPRLRGRFARHVGSGPGLDTVSWGEVGGNYEHTLTTSQMPSHNHTAGITPGSESFGNTPSGTAAGNYLGNAVDNMYRTTGDTSLSSVQGATIGNTGGGQSFNIMNPFLGMYYCIALQGIFPSRS